MTKTKIKFLAVFKELFNPSWRYLIFYGGRSSGKSHAVAQALIIRGRKEKLRILCTREVQNTIKDSVHKLLSDIINDNNFIDYEILKDSIRNTVTGTEFIFKGLKHDINGIKSTEGIDICWVEEAQSITNQSIDILTPTIRKNGSQIIFTFNRLTELDPVYVRFVQTELPNTYVRKVNFDVLKNAGLLPDVIQQEIDNDLVNPSLYAHKWLGEPLSQTDDSIISRDSILKAMQREVDQDGAIIIGADIARMGNDRTVLWKRKGLKTLDYKVYSNKRTTEVCDLIEQLAEFDKTTEIRIDDTGVGGGVTDELLRREYNVVAINFGGEASNKDKYPNWISEAWWNFAEITNQIQLPYNSDLLMELSTRKWKQDIRGRRAVESKNDYKKRGYRSPDLADACIICYSNNTKYLTTDDIFM
jgi:phage terminase large subunit